MQGDEVRVIAQVCLPDKKVRFSDVVVDLTGTPKAKPRHEVLAENGYPEAAGKKRPSSNLVDDKLNADVVTVRRWTYNPDEMDGIKRPFLGFGEVENSDGVMSASGTTIDLWSSTEAGQPVFEKQGHQLRDTIAIDVSLVKDEGGKKEVVTYWYKPPKIVSMSSFTEWMAPASQEDDKHHSKNPTFWNLTHGRKMETFPVVGVVPKIRYKLMTVDDYYNENRFWVRAQKAVAFKYYKGLSREEHDRIHFVPQSGENIPRCD